MVRTFIIPDQQSVNIYLPESYVGKTVEVIAFEINENEARLLSKPQSFNEIAKFYEAINLDLSDFKFNRDEANER